MRRKGWIEGYDCLIIPRSYPDELLSSWLTRIAFAHGYSLTTFLALFIKHDGSALSRIDLDFNDNKEFINHLASKCRLSVQTLHMLSLRSEEGYLFEASDNTLYPPKQIRKLKDKRTHYGLVFCPKCLAQDSQPYWRKEWRYLFYNACPKHHLFLTDRCGACYERVHFSKMKPSEAVVYCSKCGHDLRKTITRHISLEQSLGIKAIKWFEQGLKEEYFVINNTKIPSLFVVHVYNLLYYKINSLKKSLCLESFPMIEEYQQLCEKEVHYHSKKATPIYKNFYITAMIYELLQNFPTILIRFAKNNNLTHRDFLHTTKIAPFWFKEAIDRFIPLQDTVGRIISENEVKGAVKYLKRIGQNVTQKNVAEILGCHFTIHKQFVKLYKTMHLDF